MNKIKLKTRENILVFIFLTKIIQRFIVFRIFNSDHSIFTGITRFHSQRLWRYTLLSIIVPSALLAFSGGDGTAGNPFQITTAKQLDSIRYYCNISDSGKHFKLMNDIDLTDWVSFSKFTDQMKTQPTFVDWDFDTTWAIESEKNNGYPYLQWQFQTGIKNVRGGNNRSVNRISLYIQNRTIIFPSSLPAYTTFSVLDLNGRVIYKTFVQGASVKLPQIGHRMVLWQVKQSNVITTGSIIIK
jgi:hypothetical protein